VRIEIEITATEKEALRRAIAGLAADEAKRWLGRKRPSKIQLACESLYEKIFDRKVV
jgi:hypothetical protein